MKTKALLEWQEKFVLPTLEGCCTIFISLGELLVDKSVVLNKECDSFRHRMQRFKKRLGHRQQDVQELRQQLICYLQYLDIFNGNLMRYVNRIRRSLAVELTVTSQDVRDIKNSLEQQEDREFLKWLLPKDLDSQHTTTHIADRVPDTGKWFLESLQYTHWCDEPAKILLCPGKPGAGKSMMCLVVAQDLIDRYSDSASSAVLYCNYKRQGDQTVENILLSLLKQLLHGRSVLPSVKDLLGYNSASQRRPTLAQIVTALRAVIAQDTRTFLIIDALDECNSSTRRLLLLEVFKIVSDLKANLLATTRPTCMAEITKMEALPDDITQLEISATTTDIDLYVANHLPTLVKKKSSTSCGRAVRPAVGKDTNIQDRIKVAVREAASGM